MCVSDRNSNNSIPTINTHGWHTHTHTRAIVISIYISANAHRHTHTHERRPTEINTNILLIIRLLAKTIEDIPPKYLFLMILLPFRDFRQEEIVLHTNRTLKFQVLRSNPLLADFKLQR